MQSKFGGLALAVDKPNKMTILDPATRQPIRDAKTGEEAWIELYSSDSAVARHHNFAVTRRRLNTGARGQRIKISPEELEAEAIDLLAALTTNWSLINMDGTPLKEPFSPESARELYKEAWLREQVDDFVSDRANFSKPSSQS